ncbi:MAG: diguanylate cyclase [Pseudomonadota bacterium]
MSSLVSEVVAFALLYVVLARLGMLFVDVRQGIVTPFWLPAGVMLALAALRGRHILTAILLGATINTVSTFHSEDATTAELLNLAVAGLGNGFGDITGVLIGLTVIERVGGITAICTRVRALRDFLLGAVLGGTAVASVVGVLFYHIGGLIPYEEIRSSLLAWWAGDSVAVLLLTPLILVLFSDSDKLPSATAGRGEMLLVLLLAAAIPFAHLAPIIEGVEFGSIGLTGPLMAWALLRCGVRTALSVIFWVTSAEFVLLVYGDRLGIPSTQGSVLALQYFVFIRVATLLAIASLVWQQRDDLASAQNQAGHDPLTGLLNRRGFVPFLDAELARLQRHGSPFAIAMFDVDRFKWVNDRLGHAVGDTVLCMLSRTAEADLREGDVLARWGGEEFILLLADTTESGASIRVERLRQLVEQGDYLPDQRLTISIGIAVAKPGVSSHALLSAADQALYEAKDAGRNQFCVSRELGTMLSIVSSE